MYTLIIILALLINDGRVHAQKVDIVGVLRAGSLPGSGDHRSTSQGNSSPSPDDQPSSADEDHVMGTQSDRSEIEKLQDKIDKLQSDVGEIVRSFSTLKLTTDNPSVMAKAGAHALANVRARNGTRTRRRSRRDLGSFLPMANTSSLPSSSSNFFGPYSYPMFSGQCFLCPAGVPGPRGPPGPAGIQGRDGRDGRDASLTPQGLTQEAPAEVGGTPGLVELGLNAERPAVRVANASLIRPSGAVYIRWGNSQCREGSELVYSGTVGGALYTHTGSGSNHLCLPDEPIYDEVDGSNADRALLYTAEYETDSAPERLRSVDDHTPTCAVCRAPAGRASKLMIPARNACPSDEWRLEYKGYLMAAKYTFKRSEFICVDREMEIAPGTATNVNGALLYMVEARCSAGGGIPCAPYENGYELTCALCTI